MEEATLKAVARELSLEKDFDQGTTGLIMVMVMMVRVKVLYGGDDDGDDEDLRVTQ